MKFIALWTALQLAKLVLAATLPLFVDEAFYAWEGRSLALAYSDLPGLTAWLTRLGTELGGQHALAIRAPFLLLGAAVPWLVVAASRVWLQPAKAYLAGLFSLLMPLSGLLGVLALPDVPLVFAALLCLLAILRLREEACLPGFVMLAAGLVLGALSHYRFALVVAAGLAGLLLDPRCRRLLKDFRLWLVLAVGAAAWLPLLQWNLQHASAGLKFQFVERNPWAFHADGVLWLPIQALLLSPAMFVLLIATGLYAWRHRRDADAPWGLLAGVALVSVAGYFLLGFFADSERVSFHWPQAGWLVLATAAPLVFHAWRRPARLAVLGLSALSLLLALGFLAACANPDLRARLAASKLYPADFAGASEIAGHVRQAVLAPEAIVVASNFGLAAQLAFALDRRDIRVLDSPLNRKHGRAAQLGVWGLQFDAGQAVAGQPLWFIADDSATAMKLRLALYHQWCDVLGPLTPMDELVVDHGRKRFLLYRLAPLAPKGSCVTPALAWIDSPGVNAPLPARFAVSGWAFKDGVGVTGVEITLDGRPIATARYGQPMPGVRDYWKISTDPNQPNVGFSAQVDASGLAPGRHWLALRIHGADGSIETLAQQAIVLASLSDAR